MQDPTSFSNPATPVVQIRPEGNGRTALWILISVVVGFSLPVCSCAVLLMALTASLATLPTSINTTESGTGPAVAIVRVEGVITSSDDKNDFTSGAVSAVVINDLRTAANDPDVKAIILRVDSPGGSVTGSAQIYEEILKLDKPVVVSMASTAASGGYYVSAPSDYIFARPDTVTGSIGVILTLYNAKELIDTLGVDVIEITSGPNKAIGSSWETMTPEQEKILRDFVGESYDEFVRVVADGRHLDEDVVRQLADGRIYTGRQALANGLVDELGDLEAATAKAATLGGISGEPRIIEYEHIPSLTDILTNVSSNLNQTQAQQALEAAQQLTAPSLEYRYVGPVSK